MVIFSEHQNDVDDIHEYLLIKGVEVVGLHGAKRKHYLKKKNNIHL